jgi:hypothetical protein
MLRIGMRQKARGRIHLVIGAFSLDDFTRYIYPLQALICTKED